MKSRQVGYLLLVVIVIGVVGLLARLLSSELLDESELTGLSLLNEEVIDRVIMKGESDEVTILKDGDGEWFVDQYPVFPAKLFIMWDTVSKFNGADLVSKNPENHWLMGVVPEHGTTVQFWDGNLMQEELIVGDHFSGSMGMRQLSAWSQSVRMCYIRRPDTDEVYGITCIFSDNFAPIRNEWKSPLIAEIPADDILYFTYEFRDDVFQVQPVAGGGWAVVSDDGAVAARDVVMSGIMTLLQRFIADNVPSDDELLAMDFENPYVKVGIITKPDSETESIQFMVTENDDSTYFVKDATKSYAFIVESDSAYDLISNRERFTTEPVYESPVSDQPAKPASSATPES